MTDSKKASSESQRTDQDVSEENSEEGDDEEVEEDEEAANVEEKEKGNETELKQLLSQAILELIDEIGEVDTNIARDARDHIHSGEIILTIGNSATTESFLKAAKDRHFTVIVAEGAPSMSGHALARSLSTSPNLSVLLVPDSNVHALMPRISKIILSPHAILPNGALLCAPGSSLVCSIARERRVPIVALAGLHRLSANWDVVGLAGARAMATQDLILPREFSRLKEEAGLNFKALDYVNLPDLIITNTGEHPPAFVYRLIKENYRVDV
ncbi:nagb/rpia/CoA transferase-like protein [Ceraceosorus guamensis]|uniref:Translation initiation factor eIF2B subunit beta n=1 Tax=Ceraceosorus guamensis TaxID=1522189 RepID=A0A316VXH0_9BASI|nr:nagb/rpia/CoA transferase-like protein [Ceraceosorus guamensis]PWN42152.1 nagb/rpia/CoA transferase-like protein [Ceraceosorus guamensis]